MAPFSAARTTTPTRRTKDGRAGKQKSPEFQPDAPEEQCCRFCFDCQHCEANPLIAPCQCSGSMKYVHRDCLDEWRIQSFNPKALVQCTICSTPFRLQNTRGQTEQSWKTALAIDIVRYLGLRFLAFFGAVCVMGFLPFQFGVEVLHPNPMVRHMLGGTIYTFATAGATGLLYAMWYVPWGGGQGSHFVLRDVCPKRSGGGGKSSAADGIKGLIILLAVVGVLVLLFFLLRGLYRLICEARQNIVGAVRGANAQARRRIVKEHVVLDLESTSL